MIRKAGPEDALAIARFLEAHIENSMFLLGNLEAHGIGNTDHPYGTHYFLRETGDGITGVFGCTNGGMLMCQLPGLKKTEAQTYAHLLQGYSLQGMTGAADQVDLILGALPVPPQAWQLRRDEPLYALRIAEMASDPVDTRAACADDLPLLTTWFAPFVVETGLAAPDHAAQLAAERAESALASGTLRLLIENGAPVAMAALNARAGTAVQVGGVYVPPELRGQGRGGRVVAGLLRDVAAGGATRAILFAASPAAARAYERIGFDHIGAYHIAMLRRPVTLGPPT